MESLAALLLLSLVAACLLARWQHGWMDEWEKYLVTAATAATTTFVLHHSGMTNQFIENDYCFAAAACLPPPQL